MKSDAGAQGDASSFPTLLLRLAVSGFLLGWGLWLLSRLGSHTGAWLLFHAEIPHRLIGPGERTTGYVLLLLALFAWLPGRWAAATALGGLLAFGDACMGTLNGGYTFANWTIPAHALRIAAPLVLALRVLAPARPTALPTGRFLLQFATAVVFLTHGAEAMAQHPGFQDFLIGTADRFLDWEWTEASVRPILLAIGLMDLGLALAAILGGPRPLFLWMAVWGLVTAAARVTTFGWDVYPEILLRLPHAAVPLLLWWGPRRPPN
jgi:hypothetical protein